MPQPSLKFWAVALLAGAGIAGCGLKGALTLPPKSDEVVIRAPGQPAATEGAPATGATDGTMTPSGPGAAAPAAPGTATPATPAKPRDERIPPPPLPGGNPGTARGG